MLIALGILIGLLVNLFVYIEVKDREYHYTIEGTRFDHAVTRIILCVLTIIPWGITALYLTFIVVFTTIEVIRSMIHFVHKGY